jgi:cytochrome c553
MGRSMNLKIALLVIASFAVASATGADEFPPARNCTWCHGTAGRGFASAPRLAGQRAQYIFSQLRSFRIHTRDNPFSQQYMWGAVENLDPAIAHALASYFSTLPPRPASDGDLELAAAGRAIYLEGIPDYDVVVCAACHGPNGEGAGEIPRLGGLSYAYLKRRLEQWGEGYHAAAQPPMPRIAAKLAPNEIEALASYLSFLE